jgi:hypothetical protein
MWGFQPLFRSSVEHAVEEVLNRIGLQVEPEVYLVGFLVPGGNRHPICIEPETGPFRPDHLADVRKRTQIIFREDPESRIIQSDPRHRQSRQQALRDMARARAIKEALEGAVAGSETVFFVGRSTLVEQHEVHTVIGLPLAVVTVQPQLQTQIRDRAHVVQSLLHAVVEEFLGRSARALYYADPGSDLLIFHPDVSEIPRAAARWLVKSTIRLTGELLGGVLYDALNEVSTLRYERRVGIGSLVLARANNPAIERAITLGMPVKLSEHRVVRKLLEVSHRQGLSLLTDGNVIYGLGAIGTTYDAEEESVFSILLLGEGTWELRHLEMPILRVEFGSPRLPRPRLDREHFVDIAERVFAGALSCRPERLWEFAMTVADAEHGTMLVVSSTAAEEAERLLAQAIPISPTLLAPFTIAQLTSIDGAVLLSPDGTCHAMGVILDGAASDVGDRSRGARFNSAVRYLRSARSATMIILVSEDGIIDLLPNLRPRVKRSHLDSALEAAQVAAASQDFEQFFKACRRLEALEFYLSAEQCSIANSLQEQMEDLRWEQNQMRLGHRPLQPDPAMDNSYFLDE